MADSWFSAVNVGEKGLSQSLDGFGSLNDHA